MQHDIDRFKLAFGKRLMSARKGVGLSQRELAELCDCTRETISFIERGVHGPRFDLLLKLSNAVRTPVRELFKDQEPLQEPLQEPVL